jgi:hypothetical protein
MFQVMMWNMMKSMTTERGYRTNDVPSSGMTTLVLSSGGKGKSHALAVSSTCTSEWIIDSSASRHVTGDHGEF